MSTAITGIEEGQLGIRAHSDGAGAFVPVQSRSERFRSTDPSAFATVTGREVDWKYTPVAKLGALIDGPLEGGWYDLVGTEVDGVSTSWVPRASASTGRAGTPEDKASANAWAQTEDVLLVTVTGEEAKTATLTRAGFGDVPRAAHTVIEAEPFARALLILQNEGDARLSENVEIVVGEGAHLTVVTVQQWDDTAIHLASHFARIGRDASLTHVVITLGGAIVRVNPSLHLAETGADVRALGAYFADAGQHLEQQVFVHHDAPTTKSRVTYKGALQGEGARSVWIGDVLIAHSAPGTDSYEQNRNLVLTEGTRADSVPNLEIETGDILGAGHASATGRFDDEQLFYLQSRGIPEPEARRLVVRGFLLEVIQQIGDLTLQERLQDAVEAELLGTEH